MSNSPQYFDFPVKNPTPADLEKVYSDGFTGCVIDPMTDAELFGDGLIERFDVACPHLAGLHLQADRQVVPLFLALIELETKAGLSPVIYSGEPQPTGNCVSRGSQHARATSNAIEILVNGEAETYERPAWESCYRGRGHRGAGMDPAKAARIDCEQGFLWRRQYPFADLRQQNASWGMGTGYPASVAEEMAKHKVGKWIRPETGDQALDLLAAGYACHSGQNVGFSSRPNGSGWHPVSGRWAHDMATVGYDRSRECWDVDVVFVPNSWGPWNTQPACWPSKWPAVPGMIVARLEDWVDRFVEAGSMFFYCEIQGVPAQSLPDWGSQTYL
jgi:hypothetical protein